MRFSLSQRAHLPPQGAQAEAPEETLLTTHDIVMPDEASGETPTEGPLTFGGEDLSRRLSTTLAACDGSMSLYASAIAHKRRFEYSHSSPTSMLIDAERAK